MHAVVAEEESHDHNKDKQPKKRAADFVLPRVPKKKAATTTTTTTTTTPAQLNAMRRELAREKEAIGDSINKSLLIAEEAATEAARLKEVVWREACRLDLAAKATTATTKATTATKQPKKRITRRPIVPKHIRLALIVEKEARVTRPTPERIELHDVAAAQVDTKLKGVALERLEATAPPQRPTVAPAKLLWRDREDKGRIARIANPEALLFGAEDDKPRRSSSAPRTTS